MSKKIYGGYYIQARCIKDSYIAKAAPYVREMWNYLLREANHQDVKYGGFEIKRGQLFRSYKDIIEDLSWYIGYRKMKYCENHMKNGMRTLRKEGMITTMKTPRGVLITICNYDYYQDPKNYEDTSKTPAITPAITPILHQGVLSINKKNKNVKNKDKTFSQNSNEFRLSELLFTLIKNRRDSFKPPDLQKWSIHIDRMIRIDNREIKEIEEIIKWSHQDLFWRDVILSTVSLRDKFDKLAIRKDSQTQGGSSPVSLSPSFEFNTRDL